jgi:hypothetical protein
MEQILELLGVEDETNSFTPKQKEAIRKNFTHNITCYGVQYNNACLVITSISTYKNWRYYAGLEYIGDDEFNMASINGEFYAVYFCDNERIQRILDILIQNEE